MNETLLKLFENWSGEKPDSIVPLPQSGSYRKYFRITGKTKKAIGVFNNDRKENQAFISFTKHFHKHHLSVPVLYSSDIDNDVYLIEDLGDKTLFAFIEERRSKEDFPEEGIKHYQTALDELIKFQVDASKDLDYSVCYPRNSFDRQSMQWDLNYFKYYFLKLTQTPFDEQKLEDDFNSLIDFLTIAKRDFFMYRDFQSRNILLKHDKLYFIDYQGGRKGALQYDVASLLYDGKANLPQSVRDHLLNYYLKKLNAKSILNKNEFIKHYYGYVLIRILQAMGAYGFRGIYEKKVHFLKSIPFAVNNIIYLLNNDLLPNGLAELKNTLSRLSQNALLNNFISVDESDKLTVSINSFSYNSGIPTDLTGNGGGYVFDCRLLNNPGRYDEFKLLTGMDDAVIKFLDNENEVQNFLNDTFSIIEHTIKSYQKRNFKQLMINFGCTGGQHRSVYCAERLAVHIKKIFDVNVIVKHTELEKNGMLK